MFHADNRWWHPVSNEDDVTNPPKRGKRVQIYLPADPIKQWERTPRYERSATVATAPALPGRRPMPPDQPITAGAVATWLHYQRFRNSERCYRATVRVLDVRKKTARVKVRRMDGTVKMRFVKLSRLLPGARWR